MREFGTFPMGQAAFRLAGFTRGPRQSRRHVRRRVAARRSAERVSCARSGRSQWDKPLSASRGLPEAPKLRTSRPLCGPLGAPRACARGAARLGGASGVFRRPRRTARGTIRSENGAGRTKLESGGPEKKSKSEWAQADFEAGARSPRATAPAPCGFAAPAPARRASAAPAPAWRAFALGAPAGDERALGASPRALARGPGLGTCRARRDVAAPLAPPYAAEVAFAAPCEVALVVLVVFGLLLVVVLLEVLGVDREIVVGVVPGHRWGGEMGVCTDGVRIFFPRSPLSEKKIVPQGSKTEKDPLPQSKRPSMPPYSDDGNGNEGHHRTHFGLARKRRRSRKSRSKSRSTTRSKSRSTTRSRSRSRSRPRNRKGQYVRSRSAGAKRGRSKRAAKRAGSRSRGRRSRSAKRRSGRR
jgi:hypothetical protein